MALGIELRHLRYFIAVAEEGSFRRAAERLHITQPPLSRQVAELESLAGAKLLERSAAGVTLTPPGREFFERAAALLSQAERLADRLPLAAPSRLRVGVAPGIAPNRRASLERTIGRALSGNVEITVRPSRDLLPDLHSGRLDFGVVAYAAPRDLDGLEMRHLYDDSLVALLPAKHPAARKRRVSLLEVKDLPFYWMPRSYNPSYYDHCARVFRALGFRPRFRRVDPGSILTLQQIALGEGWTVGNAPVTSTRVPGVAYRPLLEGSRIAVRFAAVWPPPGGPVVERLVKAALAVLAKD